MHISAYLGNPMPDAAHSPVEPPPSEHGRARLGSRARSALWRGRFQLVDTPSSTRVHLIALDARFISERTLCNRITVDRVTPATTDDPLCQHCEAAHDRVVNKART